METKFYKYFTRSANIPPASLSIDDLKKLYALLDTKTEEARELQMKEIPKDSMSTEQYDSIANDTIKILFLT